ncbi:hypothetical protein NQZ68_008965 [Dissostichus eleginoides]|nr:hypothetical protein NQZ68_008965 [Dissostichus eleginoides]
MALWAISANLQMALSPIEIALKNARGRNYARSRPEQQSRGAERIREAHKKCDESNKKLAEENHSLELDVKLKDRQVKQFEKDMEVQEEKSSKQHQS